ncbi:MAG: helix-turn-helix domain-containing protein [Duncaniella sp.]|nr:helix-turn-helix domain-containing protein [Duncaniella sp.]
MKHTLNERLDIFRRHIGLSQTEFAESLGTSQPTISAILSGSRSLSKGMIARIRERFPDLNTEWMRTGEGKMLNSSSDATEIGDAYIADYKDPSVLNVDYISVPARASFIENLCNINSEENEKMPIVPMNGERDIISDLKIFEVAGESMTPGISSGALILTKAIPEQKWHTVTGVAVVVFGEFVTVKRIKSNTLESDNQLLLESDNPNYGSVTVQRADIRAIYKAIRKVSEPIF